MAEAVKKPRGRRKKVETVVQAVSPASIPEVAPEVPVIPSDSANIPAMEAKNTMSTVTVCYNNPRSIIFEVTDKNGVPHEVVIQGNAVHLKGKDQGILPTKGAFGFTTGVDADMWETVKAKYGKMPIFKNGLIFATKPDDAQDAAGDRSDMVNGFEPIDPAKGMTKPNE